jgi:hypothetical protein
MWVDEAEAIIINIEAELPKVHSAYKTHDLSIARYMPI